MAVDPGLWNRRAKNGGGTWSADRWLDHEHGMVVRSALRRIWPKDDPPEKVLDVGAGDRKWTAWMLRELGPYLVVACDTTDWPASHERIGNCGEADAIPFVVADATDLRGNETIDSLEPDLVAFVNSITCVKDWPLAIRSAIGLHPKRILVFDNLLDPTPEWQKAQKHRVCIPNSLLVWTLAAHGYRVEKAVAGDCLHRRPFLATPKWTHGLIWPFVGMLDIAWARFRGTPENARHSAWLFTRP